MIEQHNKIMSNSGRKYMNEKKRSKLTTKFIIGFILLGVAIIAVACYQGYQQFQADIQKQYNDTAYQIAHVAESYLDEQIVQEWGTIAKDYSNGIVDQDKINEIVDSEKYAQVKAKFRALRENMGANDIYLVYCNLNTLNAYAGTKEGWNPFTYVLDCYSIAEYDFVLGNQSPINPDFIDPTTKIVQTGERIDDYFVSKSDFGYNTTALISIDMGNGDNLALGVEIPMLTIETSIKNYITKTITSTSFIVIVGIAIFVAYIFTKVIKPINMVAEESSNFVNNQNAISDSLTKIKTNDEIQNLSESVLKMESDIKNYIENLTRVTAEKERIGAELDVARHIQTSMLPCIFPAFPERKQFDIYATMLAAKEVGGDFYDFFMVDDKHLALVVADVSGKGIPAALFMVIGKTLIKDHTEPGKDLGEVFTEVNNLLCESNSEGLFITAFEAVIDLETGECHYVNAGHEKPIIQRKGEKFEAHAVKPGFVLAGMENMKYKENVTYINPGDRVFLYSDGVPEATNKDGELFNMDRTLASLNAHIDLNCHEILPALKKDIDEFVGEAPQFDDITMLCFELKSNM